MSLFGASDNLNSRGVVRNVNADTVSARELQATETVELELAGAGLVHEGSVVVTQETSNGTAVTANGTSGRITMFAVVGAGVTAAFAVNNSSVTADSLVFVSAVADSDEAVRVSIDSQAAGSFNVIVTVPGGATAAAPVINFLVVGA